MSIFGGGGGGATSGSTFGTTAVFGNAQANMNPMKDVEVSSAPDDSVSSMAFSPGVLPSTFLIAGSWDNNVGATNP